MGVNGVLLHDSLHICDSWCCHPSDSGWMSRGHWNCPGRLPRPCDSPAPWCTVSSTAVTGRDPGFCQGNAQSHNKSGDSSKRRPKETKSNHNFCHMEDWPRTAEILTWVYVWWETRVGKSTLAVWQVLGFQMGRGQCCYSVWKTGFFKPCFKCTHAQFPGTLLGKYQLVQVNLSIP